MSAKNRFENKQTRRLVRDEHSNRVARKRALQARMEYLAYAPPATYEELESEVNRLTDEANDGL